MREAYPVDYQTILTSRLSDGKQARVVAKDISDKVADVGVKVECVDDKLQVIIDGARGVQSVAEPSNVHSFRRKASKSGSTRNKPGCSTGGQRHR